MFNHLCCRNGVKPSLSVFILNQCKWYRTTILKHSMTNKSRSSQLCLSLSLHLGDITSYIISNKTHLGNVKYLVHLWTHFDHSIIYFTCFRHWALSWRGGYSASSLFHVSPKPPENVHGKKQNMTFVTISVIRCSDNDLKFSDWCELSPGVRWSPGGTEVKPSSDFWFLISDFWFLISYSSFAIISLSLC